MEQRPQTICNQFARFIDKPVIYFAPVLFAEYSCLTQFVSEEIDLVVSHQNKCLDARMNCNQFIEFWSWEGVLEKKVYHLSGGWRKVLALSLFANRMCNNLLFVDFIGHLSDSTIRKLLDGFENLGILNTAFVDYDNKILIPHLINARNLESSGSRLIEVQ